MALITAAQVISISFTNLSMDATIIKDSLILAAELQYIKPALGDDLYDLIVAEKTSGSWTGLNQTLYTTYLLPSLAYFVKLKCLPDMHIKTASQGLMLNNAEQATQASSQMRAELAEVTKQNGEMFLSEGIKYIEKDTTNSFSLYFDSDTVTSSRLIGGMLIRKGNEEKIYSKKYNWRKS